MYILIIGVIIIIVMISLMLYGLLVSFIEAYVCICTRQRQLSGSTDRCGTALATCVTFYNTAPVVHKAVGFEE